LLDFPFRNQIAKLFMLLYGFIYICHLKNLILQMVKYFIELYHSYACNNQAARKNVTY